MIVGKVIDAKNQNPLTYVNIGIKEKDIGTVSREDGSFALNIPSEIQNDSMTFSMVGYYNLTLPIKKLALKNKITIQLQEKAIPLKEFVITAGKLVEKKYGVYAPKSKREVEKFVKNYL